MINKDRIVPIEKVDLISMYGLILLQASANSGLAKLEAETIDGDFQIKTNSAVLIADQPVKSVDIDATGSSVSAATLYFVPAYDYAGFTVDGAAATMGEGDDVVADGFSLYKAVFGSSTVTITKVGF